MKSHPNAHLARFTPDRYFTRQWVETRILPLVEALEKTLLIKVLYSCPGRFGTQDPTRQQAYVLFKKRSWVSKKQIHFLLKYLVSNANPSQLNVLTSVASIYTPWDKKASYTITILPLCATGTNPDQKRLITDAGIKAAAEIICKADTPQAKEHFKVAGQHFRDMDRKIKAAAKKH